MFTIPLSFFPNSISIGWKRRSFCLNLWANRWHLHWFLHYIIVCCRVTHHIILVRFPIAVNLLLQRWDNYLLFAHFSQKLLPLLYSAVSLLLSFLEFRLMLSEQIFKLLFYLRCLLLELLNLFKLILCWFYY